VRSPHASERQRDESFDAWQLSELFPSHAASPASHSPVRHPTRSADAARSAIASANERLTDSEIE
jgi:hypothetical protein